MVTPYFKELMPVAKGNVASAILLAQLEWRFAKYPNGFYKFTEPCLNGKYTLGDSWVEELGFTDKQFRAAFDSIGVRYRSKKEFNFSLAKSIHFMAIVPGSDQLEERLYCSYTDRKTGLTWYCRNDRLVSEILARTGLEIFDYKLREKPNSVTPKVEVTVTSRPNSVTPKVEVTVTPKMGDLLYIQKTTISSKSTHKSEENFCVCEPGKDLASSENEVDWDAIAKQAEEEQAGYLVSSVDNQEEITLPTQDPDQDQLSAAEKIELLNLIGEYTGLPPSEDGTIRFPWNHSAPRHCPVFAEWLFNNYLIDVGDYRSFMGFVDASEKVFCYLDVCSGNIDHAEGVLDYWKEYRQSSESL